MVSEVDFRFVEVLEPSLCDNVVTSYDGLVNDAGCYEGVGIAVLDNGAMYEGNFLNGLMHGTGKITWPDGTVYQGMIADGLITGKGVYKWPEGSSYEGFLKNGKRDGFGLFKCSENQIYEGNWENGCRHGHGTLSYHERVSTTLYSGTWHHGLRHGYGKMIYATGNTYEGEWSNGQKHGQGCMMWNMGAEVYNGEWENDHPHGVGEFIWGEPVGSKSSQESNISNKQINNIYRGQWKAGKRDGEGTFFYADGSQYTGSFQNDTKHGLGVITYSDGRIVAGLFSSDRIGAFSSHDALDEKPAARATEDVNMQFRLLLDDILVKSISGTDVKPGFGRQIREIERLVLRFTSSLKAIFKKLSEEANRRRRNSKLDDVTASDPYISSWPLTLRTQALARVLHRRFNCMTIADMQRFLRDIGIFGGYFTSVDLLGCMRQMKDHHKFVAQATLANFLSRSQATDKLSQKNCWGELVDGFLGPDEAQPNHDADLRQPLREREFVELLVRCIAAVEMKSSTGGPSRSVYTSVLDVMTRRIYTYLTPTPFALSEFTAAFHGELIQTTLSSSECSAKLRSIWDKALEFGSEQKPCDQVQFRYILKAFMALKNAGNGLVEDVSIPKLAYHLNRAIVDSKPVPPDNCVADSPGEGDEQQLIGELSTSVSPQNNFIVDYPCLISRVNFEDMTEFLCKIMASDSWSYVKPPPVLRDEGIDIVPIEEPPSNSNVVVQTDQLQPSEENKSTEDYLPPPTLEESLNQRLLNLSVCGISN